MFGMSLNTIAFILSSGFAVAALLYAVFYERIENEAKAGRRIAAIKSAATDSTTVKTQREKVNETQKRRKQVQDTLKELEDRQKDREKEITRPTLKRQMAQAGLKTDLQTFYMISGVSGLVAAGGMFFVGAPLLFLPVAFFAAAVGLPRWVISFLRKRRIAKFLNEFPNAIDVIVRAIKSGLPLNDGLRLIANEAQEPVRSEFRRIVESQQLGLSTPEACAKIYENVPVPEANFFAIVIAIQAKAGGNLSEALGNLSRVLRDRKKMKAKISALSMEAKASAVIIAALPFIVAFLVYLSSPDYIMKLFTEPTGHLILGVSAVWMSIGIFVMKNMINIDV